MKILLALITCFNPENRLSSRGNKRVQQYINGLNAVFMHMDFFKANDIEVLLCDNSGEELPEIYRDIIPNDVIKCFTNRNCGKINKGTGLLNQWIDCKQIIEQYDWIIHFEPRQTLKHCNFMKNFLSNPRNLFTISHNTKTFNTGHFVIKTEQLLHYITETNGLELENKRISIEDHMIKFMNNNNYDFFVTEKMGIIWHDIYMDHDM